ncbi:MAG: hypothetical protein RL147_1081 [Actinomycetota bacterium]|jgi:hypothetical protein
MSAINTVAYIIHLLSVLGILFLLLREIKKSPRRLNPGILHASLTALIAGLIMVGLHNSVKPEEPLNHTTIGVKFLVLLVILALGFRNLKKPELSKNVWLLMIGLTVFNIVIASAR